jgi:acyl transferase domain-containing protein
MLRAIDLPISIPLERWDVDNGTGASAEIIQTNMLRFAALVDGVDMFDAAAFRIAPAEAAAMDPQQRILLEQAYSALQVLFAHCREWTLHKLEALGIVTACQV